MVNTTLKVTEETKNKLDKLKFHPRQSYDEVIDLIASGSKVVGSKKIIQKQEQEQGGNKSK